MFLMTSAAFSQTMVLNERGDTLPCFTLPQAKFLLKEHYAKNMYKSLDSICEIQRVLGDSLVASKNRALEMQGLIMVNQKGIISIRDHQIVNLNIQVATEQKNVRIQKVYKWIAIGAGGALSGYLGYKYLTK